MLASDATDTSDASQPSIAVGPTVGPTAMDGCDASDTSVAFDGSTSLVNMMHKGDTPGDKYELLMDIYVSYKPIVFIYSSEEYIPLVINY